MTDVKMVECCRCGKTIPYDSMDTVVIAERDRVWCECYECSHIKQLFEPSEEGSKMSDDNDIELAILKHNEDVNGDQCHQTCATCRWFAEYEGPAWVEAYGDTDRLVPEWSGFCKRHPPVWRETDRECIQPHVEFWDWCGEWLKKEFTP